MTGATEDVAALVEVKRLPPSCGEVAMKLWDATRFEISAVREAFHVYVLARRSLEGALRACSESQAATGSGRVARAQATATALQLACVEQLDCLRHFTPAAALRDVWWQ